MFFVEARYHRSPERAAGQVRYIAHRPTAGAGSSTGSATDTERFVATSRPFAGLSGKTVDTCEARSTSVSS